MAELKNMLYSKEVINHFKNPKNMGKMRNSDGIGKVGNLRCGDVTWLYIKVRKDGKGLDRKITDIKFQTFGCTVAIAVSSMITTLAKGKSLRDALEISKNDVLKKAGPLPITKLHCSVLADDALHEAIYDYLIKNNIEVPQELKEKHKKTKKDIDIIEERYGEYINLEKRILEK